ncbi:unnamed protein product [Effrenium voratum]|nr:unnamed protein product [Effrenium voratum]
MRRALAAVSAVSASLASSTLLDLKPVPLLGGSADWNFGRWAAVTDKVRGGVSTAELSPGADGAARFLGNLDPSKLNAGFAGVNLEVDLLPASLAELSGLQLEVLDADGKEYTLLLKMKNGASGSSYQVRFVPRPQEPYTASFRDFVGYYRGRPDPQAAPLQLSEVKTLALQIASNFTQQKGPFQLELQAITGIQNADASVAV